MIGGGPIRSGSDAYRHAQSVDIHFQSLVAVAIATTLVVALVMRSIAARKIAETRAASIGELAAARQDLKWLREDAERKAQLVKWKQELGVN